MLRKYGSTLEEPGGKGLYSRLGIPGFTRESCSSFYIDSTLPYNRIIDEPENDENEKLGEMISTAQSEPPRSLKRH